MMERHQGHRASNDRHRDPLRAVLVHLAACLTLLPACTSMSPASAADGHVSVTLVEECSAFFADEDIHASVVVKSDQSSRGTLHWTHQYLRQPLSRGQAIVQYGAAEPGVVKFILPARPSRDDLALETTLHVRFVPEQAGEESVLMERPVYLFPADPLADRGQWAGQLNLQLYDPGEVTSRRLNELTVPYRRLRTLAAAETAGIIIVGEKTSLADHRGMADNLMSIAAHGGRVLVLAPSDGDFPIPGTEAGSTPTRRPPDIRLAGTGVIREFDQRFDALAWPNAGNRVPVAAMELTANRGRTQLRCGVSVPEAAAWPWLEVKYPDTNGILIICGFELIEHWEHGPTPRYLLVELLQYLSND